MSLSRITDLRLLHDHWLRLWFADGAIIDVDAGPIIATGSVFDLIRSDRSVFEQVRVDREVGTIVWPGEVDLDPDVLYGRHEPASGKRFARRVVRPAPGAVG